MRSDCLMGLMEIKINRQCVMSFSTYALKWPSLRKAVFYMILSSEYKNLMEILGSYH